MESSSESSSFLRESDDQTRLNAPNRLPSGRPTGLVWSSSSPFSIPHWGLPSHKEIKVKEETEESLSKVCAPVVGVRRSPSDGFKLSICWKRIRQKPGNYPTVEEWSRDRLGWGRGQRLREKEQRNLDRCALNEKDQGFEPAYPARCRGERLTYGMSTAMKPKPRGWRFLPYLSECFRNQLCQLTPRYGSAFFPYRSVGQFHRAFQLTRLNN